MNSHQGANIFSVALSLDHVHFNRKQGKSFAQYLKTELLLVHFRY